MHASIQKILEERGIGDQTQYPTGAYATQVYRALRDELFPHLVAPAQAAGTLSSGAVEFAKLRKIFLPMGIRLVAPDLQAPDPARLAAHLEKFAEYIAFHDQQLADNSSLVNECARKLYHLETLSREKAEVQGRLEALESELARDRGEYTALQNKNRAEQSMIRQKYDECKALSNRASELQRLLGEKQHELERTKASIQANREAIETLRPYVDERTGVVRSAKSSIEQLQREIKQAKAQQQTLLESSAQLEASTAALATIETQLPGLEEALESYKEQHSAFEEANREHARLGSEADRKRRTLASLTETVGNLEAKIQQLRNQETKLRQEVANTAVQWAEATKAMEQEENKLMDEIGELRVSTDGIQQQLNTQREYNKEVQQLIETTPPKLVEMERGLDAALDSIRQVRVSDPGR